MNLWGRDKCIYAEIVFCRLISHNEPAGNFLLPDRRMRPAIIEWEVDYQRTYLEEYWANQLYYTVFRLKIRFWELIIIALPSFSIFDFPQSLEIKFELNETAALATTFEVKKIWLFSLYRSILLSRNNVCRSNTLKALWSQWSSPKTFFFCLDRKSKGNTLSLKHRNIAITVRFSARKFKN